MPDQRPGPLAEPSPRLRAVIIFLCCAGAVGGLGCATWLASSAENPRAAGYYNKPVLTDTVFAMAQPSAVLAKKIGQEGAIAFLGKKNTYLLFEGGSQLTNVASQLGGDRFVLDDTPKQLFLKGKAIWGSLSLRYVPGQTPRQEAPDASKLAALGFKPDRAGVYRLAVTIKGAMYPAVKISDNQAGHFKNNREIAFFNAPDSKPPPDFGKLVTVPLAMVVDVVLTPVYVFGLLVVVLDSAASGS